MESIATWAAPVATTIAALMTAANLGRRITGWGFAVFLVGSCLWTALGLATDQPNLVIQNIILSLLNLFGIWRWLGWQARIEEGGERAEQRSRGGAGETLFPISRLSTATIEAPGGEAVGKAVDAMAGCRSGRLAYLVVGEGGVAGVGETLHRLDWDDVDAEGEALVTRLKLSDLPRLEPDNWPAR